MLRLGPPPPRLYSRLRCGRSSSASSPLHYATQNLQPKALSGPLSGASRRKNISLPVSPSQALQRSGFRPHQLPASRSSLPRFSQPHSSLYAPSGSYSFPNKRHLYSRAAPFNAGTWVDHFASPSIKPYLKLIRIDRPIGTWLLLWPCWWSLGLAEAPFELYLIYGLGAIIMRGAGCTINDLWDRDFDAKVERTKERPLASGRLSVGQAIAFLAVQLSAGLAVLLSLNPFSIALGCASMLLVVSYPLMKRVTYWPQLVLGLTFNWGALMGWASVKGSLDLAVTCPLYLAGICWTLVYDTIYAHMDKTDDVTVGVKSTALLFGDRTKRVLAGFSAGCITSLALAGYAAHMGAPFFLALGGAAGHLAWQLLTLDINNRESCMQRFVANKWFGAIVMAGVLVGRLGELGGLFVSP